jgi:hypothetical protein
MEKCYVALIWWQDEMEVLGVFTSLADAEEFCLTMFEGELYKNFVYMINQCRYSCDEAFDRLSRYKGNWYCVEESNLWR